MKTIKILPILIAISEMLLSLPSRAEIDPGIANQVSLTSSKTLPNGAVFIQRELAGSEISHFEVNFTAGQADLQENRRALNGLTFDVMAMASKRFSKELIFSLTEKYAIGLQCSGGIEQSGCQFESVTEYFEEGLDLLVSILQEPLFNAEDLKLSKKRRTAQFQQEEQNPEQHVNSLVNQVFYPAGHPYRHIPADGIKQLAIFTRQDLVNYHKSILNGHGLQIVYVGPKLLETRQKKIESIFSKWRGPKLTPRNIPAPLFNPKSRFAFEHRAIPTAYIRAKINAPGASSAESATSKVLFEIIGEVLHEEVRTKRSLSYSIGAMTLQLSQGIGVIVASTSKPQETIEVIAHVLKTVSESTYTDVKLSEYKNVFTTSNYLTLETHDSFAGALGLAQFYLGDANLFYFSPGKIFSVSAGEVKSLAKSILKSFRVGIIFDREKFKDEWLTPLTSL